MKIFYWNLRGLPNTLSEAFKFAATIDADILVFCECPKINFEVMTSQYKRIIKVDDKNDIEVFSKTGIKQSLINKIQDDPRSSYYVLNNQFIFAVTHLMSKNGHEDKDYRDHEIDALQKAIDNLQSNDIKPVFIIGDLNANIFDKSVFCKNKLCLTFFENQILNDVPSIEGDELNLYYSPSLDCYYDRKKENEGCAPYYYGKGLFKWEFIDNLLMNKYAYKSYRNNSFKLVNNIFGEKLVKDFMIKNAFSDHLPFIFEILEE